MLINRAVPSHSINSATQGMGEVSNFEISFTFLKIITEANGAVWFRHQHYGAAPLAMRLFDYINFQHSFFLGPDSLSRCFRYAVRSQLHLFPRFGDDAVLYQICVSWFTGEHILVSADQLPQLLLLGLAQLLPHCHLRRLGLCGSLLRGNRVKYIMCIQFL